MTVDRFTAGYRNSGRKINASAAQAAALKCCCSAMRRELHHAKAGGHVIARRWLANDGLYW